MEMSVESEEEASYLAMPEQLRDKFIPLFFLPFCMKDKNEEERLSRFYLQYLFCEVHSVI